MKPLSLNDCEVAVTGGERKIIRDNEKGIESCCI